MLEVGLVARERDRRQCVRTTSPERVDSAEVDQDRPDNRCDRAREVDDLLAGVAGERHREAPAVDVEALEHR